MPQALFIHNLLPNRRPRLYARPVAVCNVSERDHPIQTTGRFYNPQSSLIRDLAILAVQTLPRHSHLSPPYRLLDACSGTGIRSLRYAALPVVQSVLANDPQSSAAAVLSENLAHVPSITISSTTALNIFHDAILHSKTFDVIDLDLFGSAGEPLIGPAIQSVTPGGLLYICATDSVAATGRTPHVTYNAYGATVSNHPAVNEQFLRLVLSSAQRAARARSLQTHPVFSFFHRQTSTARIMLRVDRAPKHHTSLCDVGFLQYCTNCGHNDTLPLHDFSRVKTCPACASSGQSVRVSGPLAIGPLHDETYLQSMIDAAQQRSNHLDDWSRVVRTLQLLKGECGLPPSFYRLGDVGSRIGGSLPSRDSIATQLQNDGFRCAPTHARERCIKTDAPFAAVLEAARRAQIGFGDAEPSNDSNLD